MARLNFGYVWNRSELKKKKINKRYENETMEYVKEDNVV